MRQLNYDLRRLQDEQPKQGAYGTRTARSYALAQMADTLHALGHRRLRAWGLKGKHVEALVREWKRQELSTGTMANRMAHLRWWARRIGKANIVRKDNASYGIVKGPMLNTDKSRDLPEDKLALVRDEHVRLALRLEEAFGLRREEAIKFAPSYADRGDRIVLKASTAKGGRPREVPVLMARQRALLDEVRRVVGGGALIPGHRNYAEQLDVYERQTADAGLDKMAWSASCVCPEALRRDHWLEVAGGRGSTDEEPFVGRATTRSESSADDFPRARSWEARDRQGLRRGVEQPTRRRSRVKGRRAKRTLDAAEAAIRWSRPGNGARRWNCGAHGVGSGPRTRAFPVPGPDPDPRTASRDFQPCSGTTSAGPDVANLAQFAMSARRFSMRSDRA